MSSLLLLGCPMTQVPKDPKITASPTGSTSTFSGRGLLAVVSLWRVVRVVESAFELSDEAIEAQIEWVVCQFEVLREENKRLLETIAEKDKVIEKLQEELDQSRHACEKFFTKFIDKV
ncbi:hypothetical protein L1049_017293 [Liquidambar formosana]|uniref:Uncharacterized protein n=1 Tax=Liquidambar formosana TaxID=63359 RepID=A0AAP0S0N5_LIQFO